MSSFIKLLPGIKASEKPNEALQSQIRNRKRLSRVILNLGMFSEVVCNWFTEDAYLPHVVHAVFGFACWLTRHSSRSVLILMKPKRHCTSIVSAVPLLIKGGRNWLGACAQPVARGLYLGNKRAYKHIACCNLASVWTTKHTYKFMNLLCPQAEQWSG